MIKAALPVIRAFSLALLVVGSCPAAWCASPAAPPSATSAALNLTSTHRSINAGQLPGFAAAHINVGGAARTVNAQTMLTPAEAAAFLQVLNTGRQTLTVGGAGTALGGWLNLTQSLSDAFGSIVIPHSVKAVSVFSTANNLTVNGDLTNSGTIYAVSTNPSILSATLGALNINNLSQGTITSVLPATLPGITQAVANLNLNLTAMGNITNQGTISSSGSLSLTAAGTITASGGTMSATNGALNFTTGGGDILLNGGNYAAHSVNFNAGTGSVTALVNNLEGTVNVTACNARVVANTALLQIGNIATSGDPTFANTGSIALQGIQTSGAPLVVVAGQDITFAGGGTGTELDTSSGAGSGGNIYLIAGAKFQPAPYTSGPITVLGASGTGGSVDLRSNGFTGIDTSATGATGGGGNVEISAFAGSSPTSGQINLPAASSITATGTSAGGPGHVFLVAGGSTGNPLVYAINVGNIVTTGGPAPGTSGLAGGHLVLTTEQPNVNAKNPLVIDPSDGSILRGGILGGPTGNSPIKTGNITTAGGQIIVFSGMGITAGNISTIGATTSTPSGEVQLIANASGKNPSQSDIIVGDITTSASAGTTSSSGGDVLIMTSSNIVAGHINTSSVSAGGGSVYLLAGSTTGSGNITADSINTSANTFSGGEVYILSASGCISCASHGTVVLNDINTSTAAGGINSGTVTISTPGTLSFGNIDTTTATKTAGSVFISAAGNISGTLIDTSTLSSDPSIQAGGVYLLTAAPSTISPALTVVQNAAAGATAANMIRQSYTPTLTSIGGNAGFQTITLGPSNTAPTTFAPGGYTSIDDQNGKTKGNVELHTSITNDNTVVVPIVSLGTFQLIGSPAAPSLLEYLGTNNGHFAIFGGNGINLGSANAFLSSVGGTPLVDLKVFAATAGSVTLNNSSGYAQPAGVYAALAASGPLSITNRNGLSVINAVSAAVPAKGPSILFDAPGTIGLGIFGDISAAGAIVMQSTGQGSITETAPGVIGGASLTTGNANFAGSAGTPSNPLFADVYQLSVVTNSTIRSSGADIDALSDMTVSFSTGGVMVLTGNDNITLLPSSAGSAAGLTIGTLQALSASAPVLSSPQIIISATGDVGSQTVPINVANFKGNSAAPIVNVSTGSPATGNVFLTSKGDVNLEGGNKGDAFSLSTGGSIIFTNSSITANDVTLKTGASGGIVNANVAALITALSIDFNLGKQGVGFSGSPGNQVDIASSASSTALHVVSAGPVQLLPLNDLQFSGASSAGTSFGIGGQNVNLSFSSNASIKSPSITLQTGSTAGSITQFGSAPALNSSAAILVAHDAINLQIAGGKMNATSTTGPVNIGSASTISLGLLNSSGGSFSVTGGKDVILDSGRISADGISIQAAGSILFSGSSSFIALQSNSPIQLTATKGNIGTSASPIPVDTAFNSLSTQVSATAPNGSVYINGLPNGGAVGLALDTSNAKGTININSAAPITVLGTSTAGGGVNVSSLGSISGNGLIADFSTPALSLKSAGTNGTTVLVSAPSGSTKPVNVSATETADFSLLSTGSVNLVGASTGKGLFEVGVFTGNLNMAAGASITDPGTGSGIALAVGTGDITQSAGGPALIAPTVSLSAGNIGSSKVSVGVSSSTVAPVALSAAPTQNAFIAVVGPAAIATAVTASGTFQVATSGPTGVSGLQVAANVTAGQVSLSTQNNSDIIVSDSVTVAAATGTVALNANGAGRISTSTSGMLIAKDLSLKTGSGSIGTTSLPITSAVNNTIQATIASGTSGSVAIANTGSVTLLPSASGGNFRFTNEGATTVNSVTTRALPNLNNGTVTIHTNSLGGSGNLNIAAGAQLTASGGAIDIEDANAAAIIDLGKGAHLTTKAMGTNNGSIIVVAGTFASPAIANQTPPTGLTVKAVGGAQYSLGTSPTASCVQVVAPGNVLQLQNNQIIFNTGAGNAQQIKMEGGVIVNAGVGFADVEPADDEYVVDTDEGVCLNARISQGE